MALTELKNTFKPELINRLDEIVIFNRLERAQLAQIALNMLEKVTLRLKQNGITAHFSADVALAIADADYETHYGARKLLRAAREKVEDPIAEAILKGEIAEGDIIECGWIKEENRLSFRSNRPKEVLMIS